MFSNHNEIKVHISKDKEGKSQISRIKQYGSK